MYEIIRRQRLTFAGIADDMMDMAHVTRGEMIAECKLVIYQRSLATLRKLLRSMRRSGITDLNSI